MIARLRRLYRLWLLKAHEEQLLVEIDIVSRRRILAEKRAARDWQVVQARINALLMELRRTRSVIATLEDPQKMLDEALARRTDVH